MPAGSIADMDTHRPTEPSDGYRRTPGGGPSLRSDIIDVYIFRRDVRAPDVRDIHILQLLRATEPMAQTWQPVMGHIEPGETAVVTALRELKEEVGLVPGAPAFTGMWALEQVYPYYIADLDCIVLSPRFAVEVASDWSPTLNAEHSASRWIGVPFHAGQPGVDFFLWPGQRSCVADLLRDIVPPDALTRERLRVGVGGVAG